MHLCSGVGQTAGGRLSSILEQGHGVKNRITSQERWVGVVMVAGTFSASRGVCSSIESTRSSCCTPVVIVVVEEWTMPPDEGYQQGKGYPWA